jgi:two-component system nitrate/nitrite sensor histidine kinase NarX
LFSFVFRADPRVDGESHKLLEESLRLAELALDAYRWRAQTALSETGLFPASGPLSPEVEARVILGERARVAREIHDGLAQTLAFLKIEIDRAERLIEKGDSTQAASVLSSSSRTLSDAFLDARQAIEDLRRLPLGDLTASLRQVGEDFEALSGLRVDFHLLNLPIISANVQAQIIRIVQEALTNVRKHANASLVKISACEKDGMLHLEVQDNGPGFASTNPIAKARFGLRGMRERAEIIGAEFQVESQPGAGVTIRLNLPIPEEAM